MSGRRVAGGGVGHEVEDLPVSRPDLGVGADRDPRVRLVDQPYVGHGEHLLHDPGPDRVDRGVVVVVRFIGPGRRVEHRAPHARRQRRHAVQVELWPADPHEAVGVELEQAERVPLDRRLAGDEDAVVGLGVVARHALLVALAVVDVHVQHPGLEQRVEVARRVVAVERHLGVQLGVQVPELGEVGGQQDRQRRLPADDGRGVGVAATRCRRGSCASRSSRTGSHWASW